MQNKQGPNTKGKKTNFIKSFIFESKTNKSKSSFEKAFQ